jgi:ubiquinone biosynthesis protein
MFSSLASLWRLMRAAFVLAQHDALLPGEYQRRMPWYGRALGHVARLFAHRDRDEPPGKRLARALERLGPVYIKLGQLLSTRADVVGETFSRDLAGLQDRLAPVALDEARALIEAEIDASADTLFSSIAPAMNGASVAQVHKAVTSEGREVALKVLRPGIGERVRKDVRALKLAAQLGEGLFARSRRLRPKAFVATLESALYRELDLRLEAANASELSDIAITLEGFEVPVIDWKRSGRAFMTMDWVDAVALTNPTALDEAGIDRPILAKRVIQTFLTCALQHGVFHADMHEGNLYVEEHSNRLIAIDFGIVGRIGHAERRYLAEILYGFLRRDYQRIAEVHFEAGYVPAHHSTADFAAALRAVGEPIFGKTADQVSMARVLMHLFDVTALFDMALRPELVLLQKTMVQAEGVARRIDSAFDMWGSAEPVVTEYVKRELGPEGRIEELIREAKRFHEAARQLPDVVDKLAKMEVQPKSPWRLDSVGLVLCGVALGAVFALVLAG